MPVSLNGRPEAEESGSGAVPSEKPSRPAANVIGAEELVAKTSAVTEQGTLRLQPIDGLIFRPTRSA